MATFKLTTVQREKIMNEPIHYELSMRFNSKENIYECDCDNRVMKRIKEIVDN